MFDWLQNAALKRLAVTGVRHALTALGVFLVSKGYSDWSSIALDVSPIAVSVVWSFLEKQHEAKKVEVALELPSGSSQATLSKAMKLA